MQLNLDGLQFLWFNKSGSYLNLERLLSARKDLKLKLDYVPKPEGWHSIPFYQ